MKNKPNLLEAVFFLSETDLLLYLIKTMHLWSLVRSRLCISVDGGFSDWSQWTTCTLTCGSGTSERARSCTNPVPQHGGAPCSGTVDESKSCNTHNCPSMVCSSVTVNTATALTSETKQLERHRY